MLNRKLLGSHFYDFQIPDLLAVNRKPKHRPHFVETRNPCSARVHVQQIQLLVKLHFQDVRMAANKQFRRVCVDFRPDVLVVFPRITADVRHPNIHTFTHKPIVQRKFQPGFVIVNVAIHGAQRPDALQGIGHAQIPDIAGMPDFIGCLGIFQDLFVNIGMCIGKKQDFFQGGKRFEV